ncbi:MAG: putative LPS assembly protein LptD [Acidobacteriota bacterium]
MHIDVKPGILTTTNPFYMQGKRAEKLKDRYILHNGFISDCKPENLWWRMKSKSFDVIPHKRAITHQSTLYLRNIPIFYFPAFYKSLEDQPRRSGFLTPSVGNSSRRGQFVGIGYFWAINRSYDVTYRTAYFTRRGFVHQGEFGGWVNQRTTFEASIFAAPRKEERNSAGQTVLIGSGGYVLTVDGRSELGRGWEGRGELRQLSALGFRQEFTQSFDEAISSETHSTGFLTKHWGDYGFNLVAQRNVNYQDLTAGNAVVIRKLPEAQFVTREHQVKNLPVWGLARFQLWPGAPLATRVSNAPIGTAPRRGSSCNQRISSLRTGSSPQLRRPRDRLRFTLQGRQNFRRESQSLCARRSV